MKPIDFDGVNVKLVAPENWNEKGYGECLSLPTKVHENGIRESRWVISEKDKIKLMAGGVIVLQIYGGHPPLSFDVIYR